MTPKPNDLLWYGDTGKKRNSNFFVFRVQVGNNIYSIFCFFDKNDLVVVGHGFQKKTQKTPQAELDRAEKIKKQYYEEKKSNKP